MQQTQYPNNFGSYNVQPQGGYPPPPPPPYAVPPVQGYPAVQSGMPGVVMQPPVQGNGSAVASLVIGIISMIAWLLPIIGVPLSIVGIVLANRGRRLFFQRGMATAGLVLCIITLALALLNALAGVLIAMQ